jgi:hypothetical protein
VSRHPFITLRATLLDLGLPAKLVEHLAFSLCAEAGATGLVMRTLVLGEPGAGTDALVDLLARSLGIPTVVHDLDTVEHDAPGHEEGLLGRALATVPIPSLSAESEHESGLLLIVRGLLAAAAADRDDLRGGLAGGPRIGALTRLLRGRWPHTLLSERARWLDQALSILVIDELEASFGAVRRGLDDATLVHLGLPPALGEVLPRRLLLRPRGMHAYETMLRNAPAVTAAIDTAWSLGVSVTLAPPTVQHLVSALLAEQLTPTDAVSRLAAAVERAAIGHLHDAFGAFVAEATVTPDDVIGGRSVRSRR